MTFFDSYRAALSPVAYKRMIKGWQRVFRHVILKEMPASDLAEHFSPDQGRPTTARSSMAGLLLIMEFKNGTGDEAADAYMYRADIQYALNLGRDHQGDVKRDKESRQLLKQQVAADLYNLRWNVLRAACSKKMKEYLPARASPKRILGQMSPLVELPTTLLAAFLDFRPSRHAFYYSKNEATISLRSNSPVPPTFVGASMFGNLPL